MSLRPNPTPKNLVLYFQVHQPLRLNKFRFFDIGSGNAYVDHKLNQDILERIARECYLPANMMLLKLIRKNPRIRIAFSISGLALDQMAEYTPEVLDSFCALGETGSVEFLAETQYHSLASVIPGEEFEEQVMEHVEKLHRYLNIRPVMFRNTELIYSDEIGKRVSAMGFEGIFCDGLEKILGGQSPHHLFKHPEADLKILLRNYRLSDDIAFRFRQGDQKLTIEKYMGWLNSIPENERLVSLAMDYETFGEHQKRSTGILNFLEQLLTSVSNDSSFVLATPSEAIRNQPINSLLSVPSPVSWADRERDLSAWLGNVIQRDAFDTLVALGCKVKEVDDERLLTEWRQLQTSDHFYYMCTKEEDDGNVHSYFSPYPSPYEAFINYMNVLSDLTVQVSKKQKAKAKMSEYKEAVSEIV
jgi:alpha-amylase